MRNKKLSAKLRLSGKLVVINGKVYDRYELHLLRERLARKAKKWTAKTGIHISFTLRSKLELVIAIGTNPHKNKHCEAMYKHEECICSRCYSRDCKYDATNKNTAENFDVLNETVIPVEEWFDLEGYPIARIEWSGDLASLMQAQNYINFINANPNTSFAWWTKHLNYVCPLFELDGKPKNVSLVYSSPVIGQVAHVPEKWKKFVDHIFTVMETDSEIINCGKRDCIGCQKCYIHDGSTPYLIFELLKGRKKKRNKK